MTTRTMLAALALSGLLAVPAWAAPAIDSTPSPRVESELPTDGTPIVATVVEIDQAAGRVTLSTPHGPVDLSVDQDVATRLTPGDIVVLRVTDDEADADSPAASPPTESDTPAKQKI
jgi:hypothetical protein